MKQLRINNLRTSIIRNLKKLHTLDYIILAGVLLMAIGFMVLKFTRKSVWIPITVQAGSPEIWFYVRKPRPWYTLSLTKGITAYNSLGQPVAEVTDVQSFPVWEGQNDVYVTLRVKATYDTRTRSYSYNFQPLTVGGQFKSTFGTQDLQGIITYIGDNTPLVEKEIEAKLLYVYPWVADAFKTGLQLKDTENNIIAEIKDMTVENSQRYEMRDLQDRMIVFLGEDQSRKDITFRIKLMAKEYNGIYYFVDGPLKVGNGIHLEFPDVTAQYMEIVAILK